MATPYIKNRNGLPYNSAGRRMLSKEDIEFAKYNNQYVIKGTNPTFPAGFPNNNKTIIVFIEFIEASGSGVTIEGSDGIITGTLIGEFGDGHAPIRMDGGFRINGNIITAKGFFLEH